MALAKLLIFFNLLLFLPFLCYLETSNAYGKGQAIESHRPNTNVVKVSSLLPETMCSTSIPTKGVSNKPILKIVHRHGPCSQSSQGKEKTLEDILLQDQIRVNSLHNILSQNSRKTDIQSKKTTLPAYQGSSYGTGNYIVQVGIGTPTKSMSLIFDTGSDLTWIQCEPCVKYCYNQKDQKFDPSMSKSYSNVTCNTTECSQLKSATSISPACGSSSTCIYGIQYGDSSFSVGYFGREKLTLTPSDVFPKFQFGCGQNNRGLFGSAAGLLGLGRNKISFVSQTSSKYGGVFSYCLPSKSSSTGYLSLGVEKSGYPSMKFTPMISDSRGPSFYFLNIIAVVVGGRQLSISASVFAASGTIIDSGTVITHLPPSAYTTLKSAFQQLMSKYPKAQPLSILDTCYDFSGLEEVDVPNIAFIFQGNAKVDLEIRGILVANSTSQVCLGFAANSDASDVAILGNLQQTGMNVVYDIPKKRLGFSPGNCS